MGLLTDHGVQSVYHYAPLHYFVFIARSRKLLSKPALLENGYDEGHFRSMSKKQDIARGFAQYVHLTLDTCPRILQAKLRAGFPHIAFRLPSTSMESLAYSLCRFNVAMTRQLRRGGKPGFPESHGNGRYLPHHQIPVASTDEEKAEMLGTHLARGTMIEVLVEKELTLPDDMAVIVYSEEDERTARQVVIETGAPWHIHRETPPCEYQRSENYSKEVSEFIHRCLLDKSWLGNGLEFDRV